MVKGSEEGCEWDLGNRQGLNSGRGEKGKWV